MGFRREGLHACLWLTHVRVRHSPSQDRNYPPCKIDTLSQVFNQSNAGFIIHLKKVKNISTNRAISTNKGWMKQGSFLETGYRFNLGNKPRWFTVTTEDRGIESLWPQETQESQLANVSVHLCSSKCMESQKKNGAEEPACVAEIEKETWRTDPGGEADGGVHWEHSSDLYTWLCVKQTVSGSPCVDRGLSSGLWDDPAGRDEVWIKREGVYAYLWLIHAACIAETNTAL